MSNQASSQGGFTMQLFFYAWGVGKALCRLVLFWLIEFGALLALGALTPLMEFERGAYKVKLAGTNFMYSDPFKTVLHEDADTFNFICEDVNASAFYKYIARKGPADR